MKINILIENTIQNELVVDFKQQLAKEHGLSIFIEHNDKKILLDAGSSSAFIDNAKIMNINIAEADFCVLSHGHYDHSSGFGEYLNQNPDKKVYAMEEISGEYYSASGGNLHFIGVPEDVYPKYKDNFCLVKEITKIDEGVYIVPHNYSINNINEFSKIGERAKLYKKVDNEYVADDFSHELSLVVDTDEGLVVFNSCSHSGVVSIINEVREYFGKDKKVVAFVGGLHMKGKINAEEICTFSENEIKAMVNFLEENNVEKLYTGHCTGVVGYKLIKKYMGEKADYIYTGKEIEI